jgi:hypothetical protein
MMTSGLCIHCRHLYPSSGEGEAPRCLAFPDGVPDAFLFGDEDHTSPYPGDRGVRFEVDPSFPPPPPFPAQSAGSTARPDAQG